MTTHVPDNFPDHGNKEDWAELSAEETRCLLGLRDYYKCCECLLPETAMEMAWIDLKTEFERLSNYPWFK